MPISPQKQRYSKLLDEAFSNEYFDAGRQDALHQEIMLRMTPNERRQQIDNEEKLEHDKQSAIESNHKRIIAEHNDNVINIVHEYHTERRVYETELADTIISISSSDDSNNLIATKYAKKHFNRSYFDNMSYAFCDIEDDENFIDDAVLYDDEGRMFSPSEQNLSRFIFIVEIISGAKDLGGIISNTKRRIALLIQPTELFSGRDDARKLSLLEQDMSNLLGKYKKKLNDDIKKFEEQNSDNVVFSKVSGWLNDKTEWTLYEDNKTSCNNPIFPPEITIPMKIEDDKQDEPKNEDIDTRSIYDSIEVPF